MSAQKPWVDTEVDLKEGETLTITAEDTWTNNRNDPTYPNNRVTADGFKGYSPAGLPLPKADLAALIGKVATSTGDQVFPVGQKFERKKSPGTGRLSLQINDDYLADNDGTLTVTIQRHVVGPPPLITNSLGMKFGHGSKTPIFG